METPCWTGPAIATACTSLSAVRIPARELKENRIQFAPYIGYVAGTLTVISFLPQVVRTWKTKETKDLSFGMFALLITAGVLWITYGVVSTDWPVIATNVGTVILNLAILTAKVRYK